MKIGFIGLGKMGLNMALNMSDDNWQVIGCDVNDKLLKSTTKEKIEVAVTLDSLFDKLEQKKIIFHSTPAGKVTNQLIEELSFKFNAGDIIIDSGNSNYHDS